MREMEELYMVNFGPRKGHAQGTTIIRVMLASDRPMLVRQLQSNIRA